MKSRLIHLACAATIAAGSLSVASCASRAALEELATARSTVQKLQEQIDYTAKSQPGVENQALVSALKDAQARLDNATATVQREKQEAKAALVDAGAAATEKAAPLLNLIFPGLGLAAVGGAALVRRVFA